MATHDNNDDEIAEIRAALDRLHAGDTSGAAADLRRIQDRQEAAERKKNDEKPPH